MARFEQKTSKIVLDDSTVLTGTIEAAHNLKDHTEYVIRVQRGPVPDNSWTISKRYSEFAALQNDLKWASYDLPLPPKRYIGKMEREFIAERQQGLQKFLNAILNQHMLACSKAVRVFLDPTNYSTNLQEAALQHISMFFRSESRWEVIEPAPDIGWRTKKKYFFIKDKNKPREKYLLSWSTFGPDQHLSDTNLDFCLKSLPTFQHPYLYPVIFATSNDTCGIAIRKFHEQGTLRDAICKSKPRQPFLKKYASPRCYTSFQLYDIQKYGRQLLEVIKFLHNKGYCYGHLHAGNVIVDEQNRCRLLDLENSLLGLPSYYRPYFTQYRKIESLESVDVYCFGQTLFEMAFGEPLNSPVCDNFPPHCPPLLRSVLESILTTEACRNGLPSIGDLLQHELFHSVVLPPPVEKIQVKISSKLKQPLRDAFACVVSRLNSEQKMIHHYQRISRAQAYHMSEDEKKKRRRSKKKQLLEQQQSVEVKVVDSNVHNVSSESHQESHVMMSDASDTSCLVNETSTNGVSDTSSQDADISGSDVSANPGLPPPPPPPLSAKSTIKRSQSTVPVDNTQSGGSREALLSSINSFKKSGLKRSQTVDKTTPY